jgi:hypothetical protein
MTTRTRLRSSVFTGYRTDNFGSNITISRSYESMHEQCVDDVGVGDNGPLTITRISRSGGTISGVQPAGSYTWNNYPCTWVTDVYTITPLAIAGRPTNSFMAASLLARTQPLRVSTVSWEYLNDLHDLGSRAKDEMGRRLGLLKKVAPPAMWRHLKFASRLNLLYQFGILPLISDIETLFKFQKSVDKRIAELKRLYQNTGLRRTVPLWKGSNYTTFHNQTIQSQGVSLSCSVAKLTTSEIRGHVRWHAIVPITPSDEQLRSMAKKAILGLTIDPYTVYELMPWSWLIDYFFNLGTNIKANKNQLTMFHDSVRIMEHIRTRTTTSNHTSKTYSTGIVRCSPIFITTESKTRSLATPTVSASETILTNSQLSILGSLGVLKLL